MQLKAIIKNIAKEKRISSQFVLQNYMLERFETEHYKSNYYARGHQIPNADRNGVDDMMAQTFYSTNITPQIHYGFNEGIWVNLEKAVRNAVPSGDTLYVVTGAAFRKKGGSETIVYGTNGNDGKRLPIPNYYWKALLKVRRSGDTVTAASAIGFWFAHEDHSSGDYTQYAVSVKQIEEWTGFDLFCNLPGTNTEGIESTARVISNWYEFKRF